MQRRPVLAIDIGGTKTLSALVDGDSVLAQRRVETARDSGPQAWLDAVVASTAEWRGRFGAAGIAVTGRIAEGRWSALNPAILPVPDGYPLVAALTERLGVPVTAVNDAQAAAWGEYRFGAGRGADMVFMTVSTGVGGGLVLGGRLLTGRNGLAGHVGQILTDLMAGEQRLEDVAAGSALARLAAGSGPGRRSGGGSPDRWGGIPAGPCHAFLADAGRSGLFRHWWRPRPGRWLP